MLKSLSHKANHHQLFIVNCTQLMTLLPNGCRHTARKCTRQQQHYHVNVELIQWVLCNPFICDTSSFKMQNKNRMITVQTYIRNFLTKKTVENKVQLGSIVKHSFFCSTSLPLQNYTGLGQITQQRILWQARSLPAVKPSVKTMKDR